MVDQPDVDGQAISPVLHDAPNAERPILNPIVNRIRIRVPPIRVPPFSKQNPQLWFQQLEAQFANLNIVDNLTKFNTIISAIEGDILSSVSDIVLNPPTANHYDAIKFRLIQKFAFIQTF